MKKFKMVALIVLSLLLSAQAFAGSATFFTEVEENNYSDSSNGEKIDYVTVGMSVKQNLSGGAKFEIEAKTYDYDDFNLDASDDDVSSFKAKSRVTAYLYNPIVKLENGTKVDLGLGIRSESYDSKDQKYMSYRFRPKFSIPVAEDLKVVGDWMLSKQKDADANTDPYYYYHEMQTGAEYTGVENYKFGLYYYSQVKMGIESGNEYECVEHQLRAAVSTELAGFTVKPWVRLDVVDIETTDSDGESQDEGKNRNRFGIDVSKKINEVKYAAQYYVQPTTYDDSDDDYVTNFFKLSANYSF